MSDNDEPPRKRRATEDEEKEQALVALLGEEIDVEIGLRARLRETVESRLTWALVLQDALEKHFEPVIEDGHNYFADSAIAAFKASENPSRLLIENDLSDIPPGLAQPTQPTQSTLHADVAQLPTQDSTRLRHVPRQQLHHENRAVKEPNKYLFLRDTTATPTMIYKLACPDCGRSNFPRLQGLLNHCRLKHRREFGSHDECVQACAVIVSESEEPEVLEQGLEVMGMSASLRRLFEMAVGSYAGIVGPAEEECDRREKNLHVHSESMDMNAEVEKLALVTKTLGHHKDTPALAPFLGRAPKKRQINVSDDNDIVDIISVDDCSVSGSWYQKRSRDNDAAGDGELSEKEEMNDYTESFALQATSYAHGGSRFHVTARLAVSDWSLRLTDSDIKYKYKEQGASHRWMISVQAPSYSMHASTVLASVTVSSATDPPPVLFSMPLTASEPPFCVMGVTDKPFLARITLEWVGTRNKATQIEHWVELDTGRSTRPVLGDQQILDIELDRNTQLLPQRKDTWVVDWYPDTKDKQISRGEKSGAPTSALSEPEYINRIKNILPRFPMTVRDVGSRKLPQLPYLLPLSHQHFDNMVEGRRKAIEWGRARAIWEVYNTSRPAGSLESQVAEISADEITNFSGPVDVYRWLEAEGHFSRASTHSRASNKRNSKFDAAHNTFCSFCGLQLAAHRKAKGARQKEADGATQSQTCVLPVWAGKIPLMDVQEFRASQSQEIKRPASLFNYDEDAQIQLLCMMDPDLTFSIQSVVASLQLRSFLLSSDSFFIKKSERELTPFSLLAATVRVLVGRLVRGGLHAMDLRSEGGVKSAAKAQGQLEARKRLLVPAHIVRGLADGMHRKGSQDNQRLLLMGLARLGISVPDRERIAPIIDTADSSVT